MAKEYARKFYSSQRWQRCRNEYAKQQHHLCERCLKNGIIKAGEIVHHKIAVTPFNIDNPNITLSFDNLELVCRECHAEIHEQTHAYVKRKSQRWEIGDNGEVIIAPIVENADIP